MAPDLIHSIDRSSGEAPAGRSPVLRAAGEVARQVLNCACMGAQPKHPSTSERERIHENQRSAEEGARKGERRGEGVEGGPQSGPPAQAEPEDERPNGEGDRGLDGFK